MTDPVRAYIADVLGITQWFSRQDFTLAAMADAMSAPPVATAAAALNLLVYSPFQMNDEEKSMARKMLASVQFEGPTFISQDMLEDNAIKKNFESQIWHYGISFGISPLSEVGLAWLELPSITKFLDQSDETVLTKCKRQAWAALLKFKSERVTQ